MAENGRVYFISCGPGDPGLLTLKGARALETCPFVLAPRQFQEAFESLLAGKEVESPFLFDRAGLLGWVNARLPQGPVAVLVPGDFSIFNPFQSFAADFAGNCEVVPGVSSHVAAFALLKKSSDVPEKAYALVVTSPRAHTATGTAAFEEVAGPGRTLVLYMNDRPLGVLAASLSTIYPVSTPIAVFEKIGCRDQRVMVSTLSKVEEDFAGRDPFGIDSKEPEPALALVIVGEAVAADEEPRWWDHRWEKIWKPRGMR